MDMGIKLSSHVERENYLKGLKTEPLRERLSAPKTGERFRGGRKTSGSQLSKLSNATSLSGAGASPTVAGRGFASPSESWSSSDSSMTSFGGDTAARSQAECRRVDVSVVTATLRS